MAIIEHFVGLTGPPERLIDFTYFYCPVFGEHYKPQIFNTDQGSQFTSHDFLKPLISNKIAISMDSKGRALDNIFIERFWRTIKYEHLYLRTYSDGHSLYQGLTEYFHFYNYERKHQSLVYQTPAMWFEERIEDKEKVQFLGVIQQA